MYRRLRPLEVGHIIFKLRRTSKTTTDIAVEHGISRNVVRSIDCDRTYRNVSRDLAAIERELRERGIVC